MSTSLRSRRPDESFLDRPRQQGDETAHDLQGFRHQISFDRQGRDCLRTGRYIWRYDLASGQAAPVPIEIKEDFASGRAALVDASKHIESVSLAPDGERVIVVARGDLFSVPAKDGTPRTLTRTSNAHERDAVWSPDGKWIAYNSDATARTNSTFARRTAKASRTD